MAIEQHRISGGRRGSERASPISPTAVDRLRDIYGRSAEFQVDGATAPQIDCVIPLRWLQGGPNSVLVYGDAPAFEGTLDHVRASAAPAELLVAAGALGNVQILIDAGWVCVDIRPFMRRGVRPADHVSVTRDVLGPDAASVTELTEAPDIAQGIEVMSEAFNMDVKMPFMAGMDGPPPPRSVRMWGLCDNSDMVASAITVQVEDAVVLWNVATRPTQQRRGHGRTMLSGIHRQFPPWTGARQFLLSSSESGKRLYESTGYETIGWWQAWSRPRWAFGRA
jgi:hypothetical protein